MTPEEHTKKLISFCGLHDSEIVKIHEEYITFLEAEIKQLREDNCQLVEQMHHLAMCEVELIINKYKQEKTNEK